MKTPNASGRFIKKATPTQGAIAAEIGQKTGYLSQIVHGQTPSEEVRDKLARWGWRHVRDLIDHLAELSPTVYQEEAATAVAFALREEEAATAAPE